MVVFHLPVERGLVLVGIELFAVRLAAVWWWFGLSEATRKRVPVMSTPIDLRLHVAQQWLEISDGLPHRAAALRGKRGSALCDRIVIARSGAKRRKCSCLKRVQTIRQAKDAHRSLCGCAADCASRSF